MPELSLTQVESDILNSLPDAIIWVLPVLDKTDTVVDFKIAFANPAANEAIQHPNGGLKGLWIHRDGVPTRESGKSNFEHFLQVYMANEEKEFSFFASYSGQHLEVVRKPLNGGVLSITRDRRAQREAERKEKEKSELLNGIVENAPIGIAVYETVRDPSNNVIDFRIKLYNNSIHELSGIGPEERRLFTLKQIQSKLNVEDFFPSYVNVVEKNEPLVMEYFFPHTSKWLQLSAIKLGDGFLLLISDITENKLAYEKINEQKNLLGNILRYSSNGITVGQMIRNENGKVIDIRTIMINDAATTLTGISKEDYLSRTATENDPNFSTSAYFQQCLHTLETGEPFVTRYYLQPTRRWLEVSVSKMDNDHLIYIFTDVTAIREAQIKMENLLDELKRSNANLEEFAYAASHDLQEPLRKIHTFSEKLKSGLISQLSEEQKYLFDRMELSTRRMRTLIDDLLAFSQVGLQKGPSQKTSLNKVIQEVLQELEVIIQDTNTTLHIDQLPEIYGDSPQLRQMFQNLISNSIKYRQPDLSPVIRVTCKKITASDEEYRQLPEGKNSYYLIAIEDNGIGFEQEDARRIFKVFQRLHGRSEYEGTGVGLAIVQKVVANHKGHIIAEGKPGQGAKFSVFLPTPENQ